MTEISWGFFSKGQKVKIPLYLMSFDDLFNFCLKNDNFFNGQKSEKVLASQQHLAPPGGGGNIWYHMVP